MNLIVRRRKQTLKVYDYSDLSLNESIHHLDWFNQTLMTRRHELHNIDDMISLTDSPSAKMIQDRMDLLHSISDLVRRINCLTLHIQSLESAEVI